MNTAGAVLTWLVAWRAARQCTKFTQAMKTTQNYRYIGRGVYSLPEASKLTGIPAARLRRWLEGYRFVSNGRRRASSQVVHTEFGRESGTLALSFADLLEVRLLDAFRQRGVSWRSIRIAAERAAEVLNTSHPFSTKVFRTDGRDILLELTQEEDGLGDLLNLVRDQWELRGVLSGVLGGAVEFNEEMEPARWWPMGYKRAVVVDPVRSFGAPIDPTSGVPTRVLAAAARAEGSQQAAADWYRVPVKSVRDAVAFERRIG